MQPLASADTGSEPRSAVRSSGPASTRTWWKVTLGVCTSCSAGVHLSAPFATRHAPFSAVGAMTRVAMTLLLLSSEISDSPETHCFKAPSVDDRRREDTGRIAGCHYWKVHFEDSLVDLPGGFSYLRHLCSSPSSLPG